MGMEQSNLNRRKEDERGCSTSHQSLAKEGSNLSNWTLYVTSCPYVMMSSDYSLNMLAVVKLG